LSYILKTNLRARLRGFPLISSSRFAKVAYLIQHLCWGSDVFTSLLCFLGSPLALVEIHITLICQNLNS